MAPIGGNRTKIIFYIFLISQKINTSGTSNADVPLADPGMYQLDITLRRGQSLAARDRGGKAIRTPLGSLFCVFLKKLGFLWFFKF